MHNDSSNLLPMVIKTGEILKSITDCGGSAGISQIAEITGFSKSTIFRILKSLEETGLMIQNESTEKYQFSTFFVKAGMQVRSSIDIQKTSMPIVEKTAAETGETTNLSILYEGNVLVIDSVPGTSSVLMSKLTPVLPLYCSCAGKLFLADFTEEEISSYFESAEILKNTEKTIATISELNKELEEIRRQGYSIEDEEYEYGLFGIASPIKNNDGNIVAALSLAGPITRIKSRGVRQIADLLIENAREIEKRMGFTIRI